MKNVHLIIKVVLIALIAIFINKANAVVTHHIIFTVTPNTIPSITGNSPECEGDVRVQYSTDLGKTGYTWNISSGGNITSGSSSNEIEVSWNASGKQWVNVYYTSSNGCLNADTVIVNSKANISLQPSPVSISSGNNTSFSIAADANDNTGLNYQWQVNTGTWSNITSTGSNPTYAGYTTDSLSLTGVTIDGYSYRCIVTASSPCAGTVASNAVLLTVTSPQAGLWDGTQDTHWDNNLNWDNQVLPTTSDPVTIPSSAPHQPVIFATYTGNCKSLTINPKASLTVNGALNCEGNLLIESDNTGTGAFTQIDGATVSITGTATMQRYLENIGYHYIVSPLTGVQCNQITGFTMNYTGAGTWYDPNKPSLPSPWPNMWRIDESHTHFLCPADYNSWYATATNDVMTNGLGYAINMSKGTISVSNSGSYLNKGTIPVTVGKEDNSTDTGHNPDCLDQYGIINGNGCQTVGTGPTNGWNLIGNPYPSPVDWKALVNGGGVGGGGTEIGYGISYFKPTSQYFGVYGTYFFNGHATSSSGAFNPGRYIPAMQSFFIQNTVIDNPSLTFENGYRTVISAALNGNFYKTEEDADNGIPSISIRGYKNDNNSISDKTVIMFNTGTSDIGAGKLMNTDENVPSIYSINMNRNLSIQEISELKNEQIVPLGYDVNTSGNYTIKASEILNFPAATHIYLEDLKNNISQDLTSQPDYTFTINKGDEDNRFFLKFANLQSSNLQSAIELFDAYSNSNTLIVNYFNPDNIEGTLSIYNVLGQNIQTSDLRPQTSDLKINLNVAPGAYIVRLVTNDRVFIKKVYIQ